jgi:hypothetical protein
MASEVAGRPRPGAKHLAPAGFSNSSPALETRGARGGRTSQRHQRKFTRALAMHKNTTALFSG